MREALKFSPHFADLGCFNDRVVRGSTVPSLHREGRAIDVGVDAGFDPARHAMDEFLRLLLLDPELTQVQQVIFNRRVWTVNVGWRAHTGASGPHLDHAHIELTRIGGEVLTVDDYHPVLYPPETEMYSHAEFARAIGAIYDPAADARGEPCVLVELLEDDLKTVGRYPLAAAISYTHREGKYERLSAHGG